MFVALDIATKLGWAQWAPGMAKPIHGTLTLKGEAEEVGQAAVQLHRFLMDLHRVTPIERLYFEGGIPASGLTGNTNMGTIYKLAGLAAHAESFAYAVNARCRRVHQGTWRAHFLGKGSGFKTAQFKQMAKDRCRDLGWAPKTDNDADALGVLVYMVSLDPAITPPWRESEVWGARA